MYSAMFRLEVSTVVEDVIDENRPVVIDLLKDIDLNRRAVVLARPIGDQDFPFALRPIMVHQSPTDFVVELITSVGLFHTGGKILVVQICGFSDVIHDAEMIEHVIRCNRISTRVSEMRIVHIPARFFGGLRTMRTSFRNSFW